jgi:hypothetical protein
MSFTERRRNPRVTVCLPVTIRASASTIEGYTENINYNGALIQALTGLLDPGTPCDIQFHLENNDVVEATGKVVRTLENSKQFAVEIATIHKNGEPFLALLTSFLA